MRFSNSIIRTTLLILTSALLNPSIQVNAYWTKIHLRIEGSNRNIFEDTIYTAGHIVTTALGGTHECDGTNNGAHTTPGATIISAIDDAVSKWDGKWEKEFRDYFITSISGDSSTEDESWGLLIKYKFVDKGGCRTQVAADDQVLVAFDALRATAFLDLSVAKSTVRTDEDVVFTVVNGANRQPVADAVISTLGADDPTATTNSEGKATILFQSPAMYEYKARKDGTIRSNKVIVTATSAARRNTI